MLKHFLVLEKEIFSNLRESKLKIFIDSLEYNQKGRPRWHNFLVSAKKFWKSPCPGSLILEPEFSEDL